MPKGIIGETTRTKQMSSWGAGASTQLNPTPQCGELKLVLANQDRWEIKPPRPCIGPHFAPPRGCRNPHMHIWTCAWCTAAKLLGRSWIVPVKSWETLPVVTHLVISVTILLDDANWFLLIVLSSLLDGSWCRK